MMPTIIDSVTSAAKKQITNPMTKLYFGSGVFMVNFIWFLIEQLNH